MINYIKSLCLEVIIDEFPNLHKHINLENINIFKTKEKKFGHFQLNDLIKISKIKKINTMFIAEKIKKKLNKKINKEDIEISIEKPGFINFKIKESFIKNEIKKIYKNLIRKNLKKEKIILDFSSPNVAKNMHVGHLRSTIIGECLSKILKKNGNKVIKINHIGDWGTQFGILINYIKSKYDKKNFTDIKITLNEINNYYKIAQKKFENEKEFNKNSKKEVLKLQSLDYETIKIWKKIINISKKEYEKIYLNLDIKIKYKGESFYKKILKPIIKYIDKKKIINKSNNAKCINIKEYRFPIIIQKSDGGFNYNTTDLAALYYRIKYNKADKIIYITDVGQKDHFDMLFKLSEKLNLNIKNTKLIHIPIGLMLSKNKKKIKTRKGESEKLIELINNSINFSKKILKKKNIKNINKTAKIIGINTIKYAELSNKISQNYIFDYDKMIRYNGNTATFIMYAYVRVINILKKNKKKINEFKLELNTDIENEICIHLILFNYIIEKTAKELNPNILTKYIYELSDLFHSFFHKCNVINSENLDTRIIICKLVKNTLKTGMNLLGFKTVNKL